VGRRQATEFLTIELHDEGAVKRLSIADRLKAIVTQIRGRDKSKPVTFENSFNGGAWLLYSVLAAIVQIILAQQIGLDAGRGLPSTAAGLALIGAGVVQFTALKRACLTHCRSPFSYLLARWRNGPTHAWRIGFGHGVFCVGCCWALMGSTLAVGMANLWWMLAITGATLLEQVTPRGELVRIGVGLALLATGSVYLLSPLA
jgi:predicted metal-binding membrane protein